MSTASVPATTSKQLTITFTPLGESKEITLTVDRVRQFLCVPTKSGVMPTYEQVIQYMMLCQAQSLNPWVRDAYLVGYDGKDGATFSLIVSHQAILKRAEASDQYDGMESGVVVKSGDTVTDRPGKIVYDGEKLVGGWCRVYRRDRRIAMYDSIEFARYNTGRSRWAADPAGMIVKCAEAAALRKTYPSNLAALYSQEEMESHSTFEAAVIRSEPTPAKSISRVEQVKQATAAQRTVEQVCHEPEAVDEADSTAESLADKIAALRKALVQAVPDLAKRAAIYAANGIKKPEEDGEYDLFTLGAIWDRIEAINEGDRQ